MSNHQRKGSPEFRHNDGRTSQEMYQCPSLYKGRTGQIYIGGLSCLSRKKSRFPTFFKVVRNQEMGINNLKGNGQNLECLVNHLNQQEKANIICQQKTAIQDRQDKNPYIDKSVRLCLSCLKSLLFPTSNYTSKQYLVYPFTNSPTQVSRKAGMKRDNR
ncbi:hypothetical protein ACS5NO_24570 [Larkinella sp. GY13]|uniref:hypothetical protein n=1 Tax=Larkinella sp. GY13 TaxID=3453720 RepID=UPI003EED983D